MQHAPMISGTSARLAGVPPGGRGMPPQGLPPGGYLPGSPGGHAPGSPGGQGGSRRGPLGRSAKPITGSPETMAFHAMTIDPTTGLPKGEKPPASTSAVVSLVCGVLICLGPITGAAAIIAGVIARRAAQENPAAVGGGAMALAGIVLGAVNLLATAVSLLILLLRAL